MAYGLRASGTASAGNGSGGALALTKPAGVTDGDLMIVSAYLETDTNSWSGVPSGWNQDTTNLKEVNTGAFLLQVFWKIAAGEPASWTWTPTTTGWRVLALATFSGATGTGTTRMDVSAAAQGDSQLVSNQTAPSITPTVANDLVTFNYGNFSGTDSGTPMGGYGEAQAVTLGGCQVAYKVQTTATATGTSNPVSPVGSDTYAAIHVGWFLDTGGGGGGTPSHGPVTLTLMGVQ